MMSVCKISLTQGYEAIIDEADLDVVSQYTWHVHISPHTSYARANWKHVRMHRLIMKAESDQIVDHVNGNGLDNRRVNLRIVSPQENAMNRAPIPGKNRSYKGVYPTGKKLRPWMALIKTTGVRKRLGRFETEIEAAKAYDTAAKQFFGQFARLNFPEHNDLSDGSFFKPLGGSTCGPVCSESETMRANP